MRKLKSLIKSKGGWNKFKKKSIEYHYFPKTTNELVDIIKNLIKKQGVDADLNVIDTSKITDMSYLIPADFEGDCSRWDVSNVKNMNSMFLDCKNFNCDLSGWDVENVIDMSFMFAECKNFNCDLSKWNVKNVENHVDFASGCPINNTNKMPKFNN